MILTLTVKYGLPHGGCLVESAQCGAGPETEVVPSDIHLTPREHFENLKKIIYMMVPKSFLK